MSALRASFVALIRPCRDCDGVGLDATEQSAARTLCLSCWNARQAVGSAAYRARRVERRVAKRAVADAWTKWLSS